jgi:alkylhydroperoxidase family enzyme
VLRKATFPTRYTKKFADISSEKELADLTLAIAAINAWNRLSISARTVPGTYEVPKIKVKQMA